MEDISFDRFKVKNGNYILAFEELCYHIFCRELKIEGGVRADFNEAGLETKTVQFEGKYYGFQSKFFEHTIDGAQVEASVAKALVYFRGKLDVIFIYLNLPMGPRGKYREKIEALARKSKVSIEWIVPSHFKTLLAKPSNLDLAQFYFGTGYEMGFLLNGIRHVDGTLLNSGAYISLPIKGEAAGTGLATLLSDPAKRTVLLCGDPGGGKSLMMHSLYLDLAGLRLPTQKEMLDHLHKAGTLPMLVNLRDCTGDSLENIIRNRLMDYKLNGRDKNIIYLLDGLDELTLEGAEKALHYCASLSRDGRTNKIILSCRLMNQNRVLCRTALTGLAEYTIDELKEKHVQGYFAAKGHDGKKDLLGAMTGSNPDLIKVIRDIFLVTLLWEVIETLDERTTVSDLFALKITRMLGEPKYRKNLSSLNLLDPKEDKIIGLNRQISFGLQWRSEYRFSKEEVQEVIMTKFPALDYRSVNEICDYLSSGFFGGAAPGEGGGESFVYHHRMYQDYFFSLQLKEEWEKDKKSIRPFLSNMAIFDSLFLTYLRSAYTREHNLPGLMELNLVDDYLGKNPAWGADEFSFYNSEKFIEAIAGLPEAEVKALRSDPMVNLEEKIFASPRNIALLHASGKKVWACELLEELDGEIEAAAKKAGDAAKEMNSFLYDQLEHWRYIQVLLKKQSIAALLEKARPSRPPDRDNPSRYDSIWSIGIREAKEELVAALDTFSREEFSSFLELLSQPKHIHFFFREKDMQEAIKNYLFHKPVTTGEENATVALFKKFLSLEIKVDEFKAVEKELRALSELRDMDLNIRGLLPRYAALSYAVNRERFGKISGGRGRFVLQSEGYAVLYHCYIELLRGSLGLGTIVMDWVVFTREYSGTRVNAIEKDMSALLGLIFCRSGEGGRKLKGLKERLRGAEGFSPIAFYEAVGRCRPELLAFLLNEGELDLLSEDLLNWDDDFAAATDYAFLLSAWYIPFSREKSRARLLEGINQGILRHGWRKDTIVSYDLPAAIDIAWAHNWFSPARMEEFAGEAFDMALKLRVITDGKGTSRASYTHLSVVVKHSTGLTGKLSARLAESHDTHHTVFRHYFDLLQRIQKVEDFTALLRAIGEEQSHLYLPGRSGSYEFMFGLYAGLAANDFYTEAEKRTAFDAALEVLDKMVATNTRFYWIDREVREVFLELLVANGGLNEKRKQQLELSRERKAKDREFQKWLRGIDSEGLLQELYGELWAPDSGWILAEPSSWEALVELTVELTGSIGLLLQLFVNSHYPHSDLFTYNSKYLHLAIAAALEHPGAAAEMVDYLGRESGHQGFLNVIRAAAVIGDRDLGKSLFSSFHSFCDFLVN